MCAYHANISSNAFIQHIICLQYIHVCLPVPKYFVALQSHGLLSGRSCVSIGQLLSHCIYPIARRSLFTPRLGQRVNGAGHLNCANLRPSTAGHTSYNHPSPLSAAADRHQQGLGYWSPAQSQLMQKTMTKSINLQLNPQCLESLAT